MIYMNCTSQMRQPECACQCRTEGAHVPPNGAPAFAPASAASHKNNQIAACRPVQISEAPIAYLWPRFLAQGEARHIIELAAPRMMRSLVGGGQAINEARAPHLAPTGMHVGCAGGTCLSV